MAKSQKNGGDTVVLIIGMAVVTFIFSLYHFVRFKNQYLTGPHVRRVFDMGSNWRTMLETGAIALIYVIVAWVLYSQSPSTLFLTVPPGLYLLNWAGKIQARAFLGVIVDNQKGEILFMNSPDVLDMMDYVMVLPALRKYGAFDSVPLADVQWITRQAGKSVFLHGEFGSRRINFSNKLKRDECIHLLTQGSNRIRVTADHGL